MKALSRLVATIVIACYGATICLAAEPMMDRIINLEPIIGAYPPNIHSKEEFESVKKRYSDLKSELDHLIAINPKDQNLLFMRGYLQSMGHNFDYPNAWQGATDDLKAVLNANPAYIPALLKLGELWVNSEPALAPNAEKLFRAAQCYKGAEPLEEAQRGLFFAFYYQGKMHEALRQSEYLMQAWPKNAQYQHFNKMTHAVLKRAGEDEAPALTNVAMATCSGRAG